MTHDDVFNHLAGLPALDGWLWLYGQPPAVQQMALENIAAIAAENAGLCPDGAWSHALLLTGGQVFFTGADPHEEWIAALEVLNASEDDDAEDDEAWDSWVDGLCDGAAFQETGSGRVGSGRVGSGRVGSGRVGYAISFCERTRGTGDTKGKVVEWMHELSPTLTTRSGGGSSDQGLVCYTLYEEPEGPDRSAISDR